PYSWRTIQASMAGVPAPIKAKILYGNAEKLYGFDTVAAAGQRADKPVAVAA
ncbi:MAG: amidohydrolase, partial [Sphingomonas bacterium]|nr:amidohydrolase [Sphingomonas bacterium]